MTNTVFFTGAGASHGSEFSLPVMKGFFEEEHLKNYPNLNNFIQKLYPKDPLEEVNMESFITHLEMSLEGFGASWGRLGGIVFDVRKEFTNYLVSRLSGPVEDKVCNKHLRLFRNMDKSDTILSLNYDSVVENVLFKLAIKAGIPHNETYLERSHDLLIELMRLGGNRPSDYFEHQHMGYFIQLHGSINWLYCPKEDCHHHRFFFPNEIDKPKLHCHAGDPCQICGSGLELVIVPPTMRKAFERFPKFGLLWHLAFRKLIDAEHIVMVGLSLPDSDYYLKWLVKEAMLNRKNPPQLTIVNPDAEAISRTKSLIGIEEANIFSDLEEFIQWQS